MITQRVLPDLRLSNGDGRHRPLRDYLADFNILLIRRVPLASHGPATRLLRRLLVENRGGDHVAARAFDVRSPDQPCETCHGPHIVFNGPELATICDGDGSMLRQFDVIGDDRFFVVRSGPQVFDVGCLEEISQSGLKINLEEVSSGDHIARAPPKRRHADASRTIRDGRSQPCRASN
ncbi:MAG: hypothetical protein J5J06_16120 [Phycisphaerae bacterium]|nr:hypothetical protein [Phycisphaerae bacterium]